MNTFMMAMILVLVLTLACAAWAWIANELTYRDRKHMLNQCRPGQADFGWRMERFSRVSYDQHFRARLFLQDPERLYDQV